MAIDNIINTIRKRQGMFLGNNSITALWHFLDGYRAAEMDLGVCWKGELFPLRFKNMSEFTNIRLECHNNLGWCNHILSFCNGDEKRAPDMFFDLYDEYKQIGMRRCWKAVLSEENIQWNNSMDHGVSMRNNKKEPMFAAPVAVYVIELTISAYILAVETLDYIKPGPQFSNRQKVQFHVDAGRNEAAFIDGSKIEACANKYAFCGKHQKIVL